MNKRWIIAASVVLGACGSAGATEQAQRSASAPVAEVRRDYPVGAFDSVTAAGPNVVFVSVGGSASVRAQGPASALEKMEVVVERGTLVVAHAGVDGSNVGFTPSASALRINRSCSASSTVSASSMSITGMSSLTA